MTEQKSGFGFQDEVLILSVLIIAAGVGFADAYFTRFGFTPDVLDFSFAKILYQGVKVSLYNPWILSLYAAQLLLLISSKWLKTESRLRLLITITYIFTFVMVYAAFSISQSSGKDVALDDMRMEQSGLPKIHTLESKNFSIDGSESTYLLFSANQEFVIVFAPLEKAEKHAVPNLRRIPKDQVEVLITYK